CRRGRVDVQFAAAAAGPKVDGAVGVGSVLVAGADGVLAGGEARRQIQVGGGHARGVDRTLHRRQVADGEGDLALVDRAAVGAGDRGLQLHLLVVGAVVGGVGGADSQRGRGTADRQRAAGVAAGEVYRVVGVGAVGVDAGDGVAASGEACRQGQGGRGRAGA